MEENFCSAPYGSGKSLASTFALQIVENNKKNRTPLNGIINRLSEVDKNLIKVSIEIKRRVGDLYCRGRHRIVTSCFS